MSGNLKRKRDGNSAVKFYAVRIGRVPGIYNTWQDCLQSVDKFPNATYKSFATEADAKSFIAGKDLTVRSKAKVQSSNTSNWYAVKAGKVPGVYPTWTAVQEQITGFQNPVYRKFETRDAAEHFIAAPQGSMAPEGGASEAVPSAKKAKVVKGKQQLNAADIDLSEYAPGEAPMPADAEDGFDSSIILDEESGALRYRTEEESARLKPQAVRPVDASPIIIHTDGSTLGNGREGAIAGVGVYFGPADKRNASETLPGRKQTNQRAELTGLMRALELAPKDRRLIIKTDSKYAIQCVTTWFQAWRRNNFQTAQRKAVDNKDLVIKILDLLEYRIKINEHRVNNFPKAEGAQHWDHGPAGVRFEWLKGHSVHEGNVAADQLAVQGAQKARELDALAEDEVDF